MTPVGKVARCVLRGCLAVILSACLVAESRAQVNPASPDQPPLPAPGELAPAATVPAPAPAGTLGPETFSTPDGPIAAPGTFPARRSNIDVIVASIFDDIYSEEAQARWTPLSLRGFFTEGWDQPFVLPTASNNGVPRQGWVDAFGGHFFRAWFFVFGYARGVNSTGDRYLGQYTLFVPFNRRFEAQLDVPVVVATKGGSPSQYHSNFGDMTVHARFQLSESKDFGQLINIAVRTPTGDYVNGNGVTAITPLYQTWYNLYDQWVVKTEHGVSVPLSHTPTTGHTSIVNNVAVGRYFAGDKDGWIHMLWLDLVASQNSVIAGHPRHETYFSLTPGMRCHITALPGLWFFFAGVNVPMTGPQAYSNQTLVGVLKDY
ncbi:hypothetical protein [Paludisphaera rhizosphaerae]|uniref:hypothetical protein n=1 Tax=Paludisphaera rhizosphaerae TaxID=2711216 RepID=UPI0013EC46BF|nr:hypothetical protein [Paludisphaera rhizosphaerae]